jgi:hypothetical protein
MPKRGVSVMFEFDRKMIVDEKTKDLMNGFSAYAETDELIRLLQRNISKHEMDVYLDQTDIGCWFIPNDIV